MSLTPHICRYQMCTRPTVAKHRENHPIPTGIHDGQDQSGIWSRFGTSQLLACDDAGIIILAGGLYVVICHQGWTRIGEFELKLASSWEGWHYVPSFVLIPFTLSLSTAYSRRVTRDHCPAEWLRVGKWWGSPETSNAKFLALSLGNNGVGEPVVISH